MYTRNEKRATSSATANVKDTSTQLRSAYVTDDKCVVLNYDASGRRSSNRGPRRMSSSRVHDETRLSIITARQGNTEKPKLC